MNPFSYVRAFAVDDALREIAGNPAARFIAGGTNLLDLMKENVARPLRLIDISGLPLNTIASTPIGGLRLGALCTNAETAYNAQVRERYPLLAKAILAGASAQLRNMATNGGNLLQRTRCYYFYDAATPCNKREPGSGCSAISGLNRMHAVLGASEHCIAVHPSDMCVALAALEARVQVQGPQGERAIAFQDFHRLPGDTVHIDTNLREDELILAIDLPPQGFADHYAYLKVRDRTSYAFALVSVWRPLSKWMATRSPPLASRSEVSHTSHGAIRQPKPCSPASLLPLTTSCVPLRRACRVPKLFPRTHSRSSLLSAQ